MAKHRPKTTALTPIHMKHGPAPSTPAPTDIDKVLAERGRRYGDFETDAATAQKLKDVMMQHAGWQKLTFAQREALQHMATKIGRILNGDPNYRDNWDDIAGYAKLIGNKL